METELLKADEKSIAKAANLIKSGRLVGIPTETVYGLGADALNEKAVDEIYRVKGRAADNPLIVHIANADELELYCREVPESAARLAERFWPGPLTLVLKRRDCLPDIVTAGLDTVALRCPNHRAFLGIIRLSGCPVAAPSANISGKPSPTEAGHVFRDLGGKIGLIIDGGTCAVGVESTIIDLSGEKPLLLRPGGISREAIEAEIGGLEEDAALSRLLEAGEMAKAPGMKYRHYAPRAAITVLRGDIATIADYVNREVNGRTAVLCFDGEESLFNCTAVSYGGINDENEQARRLFTALRELDGRDDIDTIYARCPENSEGISLAVANRLLKAAGFNTVNVES